MLKFDDSMIDLHKIFRPPTNCPCKQLLAFVTARRTFINSCPSHVKTSLYTDKTGSIE